jgi:MFS family permease
MRAANGSRTLAVLVVLGVLNHIVLTGSRITVSLNALAQGASAFTVGVLISLYALLPMISAVAVGRLSDRAGVRPPMLAGSLGLALGSVLPCFISGTSVLYISAALVGTSFMAFQVASQHVTGDLGEGSERSRNYSFLSLGYSISGFIGPLLAGVIIDHLGYRSAFAAMTVVPLVSVAILASGRPKLPRPTVSASPRHGGVLELLRHPTLRRVLLINALLAMSWDLHTVFVPIYGARIELSASQIGFILASFAAATFVIRLLMPVIVRYRNEHQVLTVALFLSAAAYLVFPLSQDLPALAALSFVLGFGLGSAQPVVMSLLHTHAPPGRMGEAAGLRMSLVQTMSVAVPLLFGAIGSSVGVAPVFWSVSVLLIVGGVLSGRATRDAR